MGAIEIFSNDVKKTVKRLGHNTEFDKAIVFGLNDLVRHGQQQVSVVEEGEAAVSLEGQIGL